MTNTDNKGFVRPVQEYRETSYGLYMSRTADHAKFNHMQTWLLLRWDCAPTSFTSPRDTGRGSVSISMSAGSAVPTTPVAGMPPTGIWTWSTCRRGRSRLIDVDELFDACSAGLLSTADAQEAVFVATRALVGAADHDHRVQDWLDAQVGEPLTWLDFER